MVRSLRIQNSEMPLIAFLGATQQRSDQVPRLRRGNEGVGQIYKRGYAAKVETVGNVNTLAHSIRCIF